MIRFYFLYLLDFFLFFFFLCVSSLLLLLSPELLLELSSDEEGDGGGNSSPGLDSVRVDDKDVLIQYLEEELVKKSARINELFGLMSKARSRPLVHADVEEANDDKELLELEDDEDDQSLLDFEEVANRTEGLSDFDRKTMEEMSKRAFISRVGDEVSLVSLFSFFFLN